MSQPPHTQIHTHTATTTTISWAIDHVPWQQNEPSSCLDQVRIPWAEFNLSSLLNKDPSNGRASHGFKSANKPLKPTRKMENLLLVLTPPPAYLSGSHCRRSQQKIRLKATEPTGQKEACLGEAGLAWPIANWFHWLRLLFVDYPLLPYPHLRLHHRIFSCCWKIGFNREQQKADSSCFVLPNSARLS